VNYKEKFKSIGKEIALISLIVAIVAFVFQMVTRAGDLNPSTAPASTMQSVEDIYNSLAGTTFSATTTANISGSALQITRCMITRIEGSNCPL